MHPQTWACLSLYSLKICLSPRGNTKPPLFVKTFRTTGPSSLYIQSNLWITTTEGTGNKWSYFSGGLICQVWFKNFQYRDLHMPLHEPATSAIGSPHVYAGAYLATTMPSGACKRDDLSFGVHAKEKLDDWKVFSLNLTYVVAFHRLNRHFGLTSSVRNSHFSGGRNFKNALRTFESANWRDWNCVSSIFRWSLLSGGRKGRFDCI